MKASSAANLPVITLASHGTSSFYGMDKYLNSHKDKTAKKRILRQ